MDTNYGFKKITKDNIFDFDTGGINNSEDLEFCISAFMEPQLSDLVSVDIRALFEVARGTMIYGLFYYPLYTMGIEQLFRICETALKQKAAEVGIVNIKIFKFLTDKSFKAGIISSDNKKIWDDILYLRNECSHPANQSIFTPGLAINTLKFVTKLINSLFT